jgi:hypothetical protein
VAEKERLIDQERMVFVSKKPHKATPTETYMGKTVQVPESLLRRLDMYEAEIKGWKGI